MKSALFAAIALSVSLFVVQPAFADTIAYPNAKQTSFLLDYPSDWEMTPADDEEGYTTLVGPTGTLLMLRTIPGDEASMKEAVQGAYEYIGENYTDVKLTDPTASEHRGLKGFYASGAGTDSDGAAQIFGMAWYALNDGTIGEIWFSAEPEDKTGAAAAAEVVNSFRAP